MCQHLNMNLEVSGALKTSHLKLFDGRILYFSKTQFFSLRYVQWSTVSSKVSPNLPMKANLLELPASRTAESINWSER
jgi:hypothetical protein